jgi:hypothetical protein
MSNPAFSLNLGNGVYMDSEGALHSGPLPYLPTYSAPFTLPIDPKKISGALSSVQSALSTANKTGLLQDRWGKVDAIEKLLDIIAGVGKFAGLIAPVASALSLVTDALKLLGVISDAVSPFENEVKARFEEIKAQMQALGEELQGQFLEGGRIDVEATKTAVDTYVGRLQNPNADPAQLQAEYLGLHGDFSNHVSGFYLLTDQQTWQSNFLPSQHMQVWPFMVSFLFTVPGVPIYPDPNIPPGPENTPAPVPPIGINFDHRLMFPLASFAAETFLTCIRGIQPEYRTTSEFRYYLRDLSNNLADIAQQMRENVIARTIYKPEHFSGQQLFYGYGGVSLGPDFKPKLSPTCSFWPVGAIDLRYHDDTYFNQFLPQLTLREALGQGGPTKFGTLDFRWIPPAVLESAGDRYYRIANPEQCAAAANAQSEQDYADLLSISGYPELLRLAILFRNEATEPSISQTVQAQTPLLYRNPEPISPVTVESNPIPYSSGNTIKTQAGREPQDCMCKVEVWTQPIGRASPVKYRVVLRTLDSYWGTQSWRDISYADYQLVNYQADPQNAGFLRLNVSHGSLEVASRPLVDEWTSSPAQDLIEREGTVTMEAVTFDWWVPVPSIKPFGETRNNLLKSGLLGQHRPQSVPHPGNPQMLRDLRLGAAIFQNNGRLIPELTWKTQSGDPDGQHRDLRKAMVNIRYELGWIEDRLRLTIWNDPADRSYIVFLALEEQMQGSSTILHTAVPLPVNGLLTYVPQDFFDKEFEAFARTAKIIASLVPKYIPTVGEIGSNDGINWIRPGDLASAEGINRIMTQIERNNPQLFGELTSELARVALPSVPQGAGVDPDAITRPQ